MVLDRLITKARQLECFNYTNVYKPKKQNEEDEEEQLRTHADEAFMRKSLEGTVKQKFKMLQLIRLQTEVTDWEQWESDYHNKLHLYIGHLKVFYVLETVIFNIVALLWIDSIQFQAQSLS